MVIYALAAGGGVFHRLAVHGGRGVRHCAGLRDDGAVCFLHGQEYSYKGVAIPRNGAKRHPAGILPMLTLVIILVGTGIGVFTATESSTSRW